MKDYIWVVEVRMKSGKWLPVAHEASSNRNGARWGADVRKRLWGDKTRVRKYVRAGK